jgi:hypothetical protein
VLFGAEVDLAVGILCEDQEDREATALEIGDCMLAIWRVVGDSKGVERRT